LTKEGPRIAVLLRAPEFRILNPQRSTAAADIYSLGKILYWLFRYVFTATKNYCNEVGRRLAHLFPQTYISRLLTRFGLSATVHKGTRCSGPEPANVFSQQCSRRLARIELLAGLSPNSAEVSILRLGEYMPLPCLPTNEQRTSPCQTQAHSLATAGHLRKYA